VSGMTDVSVASTAGPGTAADVDAPTEGRPSRRERVRASTLAEIKGAALDLMRERGSTQIHFADIARTMGMTAPALYRYFADRDDLLTVLIRDAYNDLADALAASVTRVPDADSWGQLKAGMAAYRAWALNQPERFALIFGLPIPGFAVRDESGTTEAAKRAMAVLESIVVNAYRRDSLKPSVVRSVAPGLDACLAEMPDGGVTLTADSYQGVLQAWIGVHGFVSLESCGHLAWLPDGTRDGLFEAQTELAARAMGIDVPRR
jgi:AcrR family transcriptional regulator